MFGAKAVVALKAANKGQQIRKIVFRPNRSLARPDRIKEIMFANQKTEFESEDITWLLPQDKSNSATVDLTSCL